MIPSSFIQAWGAKTPWPELLPAGIRFNDDDALKAFEHVWTELIARINGEAWKLTGQAIEELRTKKYPGLLMKYAL